MAEISRYPRRCGIIYGFSSGDPYFIGDVMGDLHLESPVEFWLYVSHRMKELKMSEPTVDLIILLDILRSSALKSKKLPARIADFSCNDEIQMRTYSDLMSKYYAANPMAKGPVETDRLMRTATDFLRCCDVVTDERRVFAAANGSAAERALELGYRVVEEKHLDEFSLVLGEKIPSKREKIGDIICMVRPAFEGNENAAYELLAPELSNGTVKRAKKIENGLLPTLLSFSAGLDITAYHTDGMTYPLAEICTGFDGAWLARIEPSDLYTLQMTAASKGVAVSPVATVKKRKDISFTFPGGAYRINSKFIFEVMASPYDECAVTAEPMPLRAPPSFDARHREGNDGYYLSDEFNTGCEYYDASSAVVSAVAKAVANGFDLEHIRLTNLLIYDENHASGQFKMPSKLVSHLLGIYRAQAELALPDSGSASQAGECDKVTVIAATSGEQRENRVDRGTVYLATPALSEEGFPDYGELRRIFRFVSGAVTTGKCKAEVIDARGAQNALLRLCGDTSINVSDVKRIPGAFLLLTDEKIEGLAALGYFDGKPESLVSDQI